MTKCNYKEVLRLRETGLSLEEVGKLSNISRERVRQLVERYGNDAHKFHAKAKPKPLFMIVCKQCGNITMVTKSQKDTRKFCNSKCHLKFKMIRPSGMSKTEYYEWKKDSMRKYANVWYHTVFKKRSDWKAIVSRRNKRNAKNLKTKSKMV